MATEEGKSHVTLMLRAAARGDHAAAADVLPMVYEELRRLARSWMGRLEPGQTLQPTALVHEAWIRLVGDDGDSDWNSRAHFFGAAARAMRQIMVDQYRRRSARKRGGDRQRLEAADWIVPVELPRDIDLVALDEALERLEAADPRKHQIVMLRFFAGLSTEETARVVGVSERTIDRDWRFVRAWLHKQLAIDGGTEET